LQLPSCSLLKGKNGLVIEEGNTSRRVTETEYKELFDAINQHLLGDTLPSLFVYHWSSLTSDQVWFLSRWHDHGLDSRALSSARKSWLPLHCLYCLRARFLCRYPCTSLSRPQYHHHVPHEATATALLAPDEIIALYQQMLIEILSDDGHPPLEASGLKLYSRLTSISDSIERVAEKRGFLSGFSVCRSF